MALKLRTIVKFPARVTVESPILLDKTDGVYAFTFDMDALLALLNPIYQPTAETIQTVTDDNVTDNAAVVFPTTTLLIVQRAAPALTELALPAADTSRLTILDWSSSITDHEIRITPHGSNTIMKADTWSAFSNASQLTSLALHPIPTLNGWYIAP